MRLSNTLSLYIARQFLVAFTSVLIVLVAIILLVDTIELMRRAATRPEATLALVVQMALLKVPHMIQQTIAFSVLFACMITFWRLTRSHELVVARAAGVSVWQFLFPLIVLASLLGSISVTLFNPAAAAMLLRYEQLNDRFLRTQSNLLSVSDTGLWLRQADEDGQSVFHAMSLSQPDLLFNRVTIFQFEGMDHFRGRIDAAAARLENGQWRLEQAWVSGPDRRPHFEAEHTLPTSFTLDKIRDSLAPPQTLSFWDLPQFIELLEGSGFSALRHRLYFHTLLSVPLLLCAMVLIAATFSLRPQRRGGTGVIIGIGVFVGLLLYVVSDIVSALALSDSLPVVLAAWAPASIATLLGMAVLLHIEDG